MQEKFFLYLRKNKSDIKTAEKEKMQAKNKIISSKKNTLNNSIANQGQKKN